MKTKIIYISGSKIHCPDDVRCAFDEVRSALNLSEDTVLFGVPVEENMQDIQPKVVNDLEIKKTEEEKIEAPVVSPEPAKVIPILSVLGGKKTQTDSQKIKEEEIPVPEIREELTEDLPEPEEEKTLEKLFEKLTPLDAAVVAEVAEESESDSVLAKLASEFAEVADDLPEEKPASKIGKLKNILPFKKSKREEPGIMGDLFGWAGIAANDDEYSMPGFFSSVG